MGSERILRAVEAQPWALHPPKLDQILAILEAKANTGQIPEASDIQAARQRQRERVSTGNNVAVIQVFGTISQRMGMLDAMSGGSSLETFVEMFDEAMADESVSAIVLQVDSPGGSVYGVQEAAEKVFQARGQKKVIAVADALAASAAYWLASAAEEFVVTPSGEVGSIGVYMVHFDYTGAMEDAGIKATIIKAGENKAEGNPYESLSEDTAAHLQEQVDDYYRAFVSTVARNRGVSVQRVEESFGQGRTYTADRARERGMVDRVATMEQVIAELVGGSAGWTPIAASHAATPIAASASGTAAGTMELRLGQVLGHLGGLTDSGAWMGGTAPTIIHPPTEPAPEAREETMTDKVTAAQPGAATVENAKEEARAAERERIRQIHGLATEHGIDRSTAEQWVANGMSVEGAQAAVLDILKARAKAEPDIRVGYDRAEDAPFASFGEQLQAIIAAHPQMGGTIDPRLNGLNRKHAAATGMSQADPQSGGFLVSPSFSDRIWDGLNDRADNLLGMVDSYPVEGESLTFNANAETSRATGSRWGGVRGYWIAEADQLTGSRPKFRQVKLEPQELAVMIYLTDKLLRNAPQALEQYTRTAAVDEIAFLTGDAIVRGTGAGKPLGLLNSGSLVTVAKETSQVAASIMQENISKMWARLHPRARPDSVWLHNVDVEPQLDTLSTVVKNVAGSENVGGYANKVFDAERRTLKGRPLVPCEFCSTLGTVGDLILWSPSGYAAGVRAALQSAMSIHIRFDYLETAFRFVFEVDGQPWLASAQTPYQGSNTLTTHVALATRS